MAYAFNRSGYLETCGSANSLPDGDWTIGGWAHIDSTGTAAPIVLGQDSSDAACYSLSYYEGDYAESILRYRLSVSIRDDAGRSSRLDSNGWPIVRLTWRHLLVQRSAGVIRLYVDGTADPQTATVCGAATITAHNVFGRLGSMQLAEWAQWNRALDADEILALSKGWSPLFFRRERKWFLPMVRELEELDGALSLDWTDVAVAAHPRMIRPASVGHAVTANAADPAASSSSSDSADPSDASSSSDSPSSSDASGSSDASSSLSSSDSSSSSCESSSCTDPSESSSLTPETPDPPAGWTPPYWTEAGTVWHAGAVAGRACS